MRDEAAFWQKCIKFARGKRHPEPEDCGQEMLTLWLEQGKPDPVNLYILFCNACRKLSKWDHNKQESRDPLRHSVCDDGENNLFERIAAQSSSIEGLDDDEMESLAGQLEKLRRIEEKEKRLEENFRRKEAEIKKMFSRLQDDPSDWPLPVCSMPELEREHIRQMLNRFGGNRTHTAKALGISLRSLRYKAHDLEAPPPQLNARAFVIKKTHTWSVIGPTLKPRSRNLVEKCSDEVVLDACRKKQWNISQAAEMLGLNRTTIHERLKRILEDNTTSSDKQESRDSLDPTADSSGRNPGTSHQEVRNPPPGSTELAWGGTPEPTPVGLPDSNRKRRVSLKLLI